MRLNSMKVFLMLNKNVDDITTIAIFFKKKKTSFKHLNTIITEMNAKKKKH